MFLFFRCGHCKKLAPEYSIAARILRPSVLLAKLDATVQKKVAEKYEVKSYPTLKLFKEGEEMPIDFDGERDSSCNFFLGLFFIALHGVLQDEFFKANSLLKKYKKKN